MKTSHLATRQGTPGRGPSQHMSQAAVWHRGIWASIITPTGNDTVNSTVDLAIFKSSFYFLCFKRKKGQSSRISSGSVTKVTASEQSTAKSVAAKAAALCGGWGPCPAKEGRGQAGSGCPAGPGPRPASPGRTRLV